MQWNQFRANQLEHSKASGKIHSAAISIKIHQLFPLDLYPNSTVNNFQTIIICSACSKIHSTERHKHSSTYKSLLLFNLLNVNLSYKPDKILKLFCFSNFSVCLLFFGPQPTARVDLISKLKYLSNGASFPTLQNVAESILRKRS